MQVRPNQYYYNGEKTITCAEAHALKDKSKLIVADKAFTITARKKQFPEMFEAEEIIEEEEEEEI